MIRLTPEQSKQVLEHPNGVECHAEGSEQTFVIMDADVVQRMRRAFYRNDTHESLTRAIDDMEAGRMMSVDDSENRLREEMGFPPRAST